MRTCYTFRFHSNKRRHKFTVTFPFRTSSCSCLIVWRARSFVRSLAHSIVLHVNVHGLTGEQGYNCSSFYSLHSASPVSARNIKPQPLYPNWFSFVSVSFFPSSHAHVLVKQPVNREMNIHTAIVQSTLIGTHSYLSIPLPNNIFRSSLWASALCCAVLCSLPWLCICVCVRVSGWEAYWFASVRDAHSFLESRFFRVYNMYVCLKSNNSLCSAWCVWMSVSFVQHTCSCVLFSKTYNI